MATSTCVAAAHRSRRWATPPSATLDPDFSGGTQIGKRYADEESGLEVLVTKAGPGSLSIGTDALAEKGAKPLPSSD